MLYAHVTGVPRSRLLDDPHLSAVVTGPRFVPHALCNLASASGSEYKLTKFLEEVSKLHLVRCMGLSRNVNHQV